MRSRCLPLLVLLAACGDDAADSDAGPPADAGLDAGAVDGGDACTLGEDGLEGACFPRCSEATFDRITPCRDAICLRLRLQADTTPAGTAAGAEGPIEIDCLGCVEVQQRSCLVGSACEAALLAFEACEAERPGACLAEQRAVEECAADDGALAACVLERSSACLGFEPPARHDAGPAPPDRLDSLHWAILEPTGADGPAGRALVVRERPRTRLSVQASGLTADRPHEVLVTRYPCEHAAGGPAYLVDPAAGEAGGQVSLVATSDGDGVAAADTELEHLLRGDGLSVVVREPDASTPTLCGTLRTGTPSMLVSVGALAPFAAAEARDAMLAGEARLSRQSPALMLELTGLEPAEEYVAHVHELPCGILDGGAHYRNDPTVTATREDNELWVTVPPHPDGAVFAMGVPAWPGALRTDAQSVVLHRLAGADAPRIACADVPRQRWSIVFGTTEPTVVLPTGAERGLEALSLDGSSIVRALNATTTLRVEAAGLPAGASLDATLHDRPCAVHDGGAPYRDAALGEGPALSMALTEGLRDAACVGPPDIPTGTACAERTALALAQADATSIVVTDPSDGARVACADLR